MYLKWQRRQREDQSNISLSSNGLEITCETHTTWLVVWGFWVSMTYKEGHGIMVFVAWTKGNVHIMHKKNTKISIKYLSKKGFHWGEKKKLCGIRMQIQKEKGCWINPFFFPHPSMPKCSHLVNSQVEHWSSNSLFGWCDNGPSWREKRNSGPRKHCTHLLLTEIVVWLS